MIGEKKYFLDFKKKAVGVGVVYAEQISAGGWAVYLLKTDEGIKQIETCLSYDTEAEALAELKNKLPIALEMVEIEKQAKKTLDELREKLIGKAEFKNLLEGARK
jgi:hypothetical protein